jgi:hypothetical protein
MDFKKREADILTCLCQKPSFEGNQKLAAPPKRERSKWT